MAALPESWAVGYAENLRLTARQLAQSLHLPLDNAALNRVMVTDAGLALQVDSFLPQYADFSFATWQKKRDTGKKQGILRACKPGPGVRILDMTAGWGRDAALLAVAGAHVVMLEREPIMAAVLRDALARQDALSQASVSLTLVEIEAFDYLAALDPYSPGFDCITLDPMHPVRKKSALVKKDLQALQKFIPPRDETLALIARARTLARVVLKWPARLPSLTPPSFVIPGKTIRYDVYCRLPTPLI